MRLHISVRARAWLGALAFSGAVGGHILAYALVEPGEHERAELLRGTGHGLWAVVVALALAGLVGGLAGCLREGAARLRGAGSPGGGLWSMRWERRSGLYATTAGRLVALQVSSFLLLETAERTLAHGHLHLLTAEPAVVVGVLVQLVTALVGAGLLVLLARVVERLRGRGSPAAFHSRAMAPVLCLPPYRHRLLVGGSKPRGPPLPLRLSA